MAQSYRDTRLTTLARLKAYGDPTSERWTDTSRDAFLSSLIRRASGLISDWCEREFEARVRTLYLDGHDRASLHVPHWPVAQPEPTRTLAFTSGGTYQVRQDDTVTGATSGATALVCGVGWLTSGRWEDGDAAGTFYLADQSGTFAAETLNVTAQGQTNIATVAGNSAASVEFGVWVDAGHDFAAADKIIEERDGVSGDYVVSPGEEGRGRLTASKWSAGTRNVKVVALTGYDQVPDPVEHATVRLVLNLYEEALVLPHAGESADRAPGGGTVSIGTRRRLPADVEAALWPYRRSWAP